MSTAAKGRCALSQNWLRTVPVDVGPRPLGPDGELQRSSPSAILTRVNRQTNRSVLSSETVVVMQLEIGGGQVELLTEENCEVRFTADDPDGIGRTLQPVANPARLVMLKQREKSDVARFVDSFQNSLVLSRAEVDVVVKDIGGGLTCQHQVDHLLTAVAMRPHDCALFRVHVTPHCVKASRQHGCICEGDDC